MGEIAYTGASSGKGCKIHIVVQKLSKCKDEKKIKKMAEEIKEKCAGKTAAEIKEILKKDVKGMDKLPEVEMEALVADLADTVGASGADFVGKLYGRDVVLEGVKTLEIKYVKRTDEEREKLRKEFDSTEREKFVKKLAEECEEQLREAGITDEELLMMRDGLLPSDEWQVHHKVPLDGGGTNNEENLVLIKNHPYHKVITNHQNSITRKMKGKDEATIEFPIPPGKIYPPETREEFERSIPKAEPKKKKKKKS